MKASILVTGGAGFIGSHICIALYNAGYTPLILDNLSNAHWETIERISKITGSTLRTFHGDVRDSALLNNIFLEESIDGVIHLAGIKDVNSAFYNSLKCYENNVLGSISLIKAMDIANIKKMIFASSSAVYGVPDALPITEFASCKPINPYGRAKYMTEQVLQDLCLSNPEWGGISLRYFNPAGAHESGLIGESIKNRSPQLLPSISQVALGVCPLLQIYGDDFPTHDGTAIRDYVHVMDLAHAHVLAIDYLLQHSGFQTLNLGTGQGHTVLDAVNAMERISSSHITYEIGLRKPGDVPECWADSTLAHTILGWRPHRTLANICEDILRWHRLAYGLY